MCSSIRRSPQKPYQRRFKYHETRCQSKERRRVRILLVSLAFSKPHFSRERKKAARASGKKSGESPTKKRESGGKDAQPEEELSEKSREKTVAKESESSKEKEKESEKEKDAKSKRHNKDKGGHRRDNSKDKRTKGESPSIDRVKAEEAKRSRRYQQLSCVCTGAYLY